MPLQGSDLRVLGLNRFAGTHQLPRTREQGSFYSLPAYLSLRIVILSSAPRCPPGGSGVWAGDVGRGITIGLSEEASIRYQRRPC